MKLFKPKDFAAIVELSACKLPITKVAADIANRILTERGVRVYGNEGENSQGLYFSDKPHSALSMIDTHQALLVCIEELPKAECLHTPHEPSIVFFETKTEVECSKCGVKLRAKWEPA